MSVVLHEEYKKHFNIHRKCYLDKLIKDTIREFYDGKYDNKKVPNLCYNNKTYKFEVGFQMGYFHNKPNLIFISEFGELKGGVVDALNYFDVYSFNTIIKNIKKGIVANESINIKIYTRKYKLNKLL